MSSLAAHADVIYTVTGSNFENVSGPYTTNDSVTGEFTFSSPITPTNSGVIAPDSYSLSDGVQTLTQNNSYIAHTDFVADSNGNITFFYVSAISDALPDSAVNITIGSEYVTYNLRATSVGSADSTEGVSISGPMSTSSVTPEPSSFALLSTGMLGVAGVVRKRFE